MLPRPCLHMAFSHEHPPRVARCASSGSTAAAPLLRVPPIGVSGSWLGAVATLIQPRLWTTSSPHANPDGPDRHLCLNTPL